MLISVTHSTLLYGAPIWEPAIKFKKYKNMLFSCQRKVILIAASAYRTVGTETLLFITGIPPIDLLITERKESYKADEISKKEQ
ncbi:hypothetical protein BDFB_013368 [Asbolus verrucosus]|uniref:Uncharacterized protein n=1 Tax=Asbolus verrucosus TaxID=1661398 RepID=A0A482W9S8_ASBVE|nr:hypothetical protein BDFB_013368 [Asbolus verrucosus]